MIFSRAFLLAICCFLAGSARSYIDADKAYIVQLKPAITSTMFREKLAIPVLEFSCADKDFRLYKLVVSGRFSSSEVLQKIRETGMCHAWQKLNLVRSRSTLPNDPLLAQQKYIQTIRAAEVWDFGNNAVTRKGDTIVVAIIDSGMDTLHPDLKENQWRNHLEIPHNGIDDDSNGYADDYYGWNGGDSNAKTYTTVTLDGHGTAIAGEIAARGNNNLGVSGLHWNAKVMPIVCYGTKGATDDIGVVRSLLYAYRMKKLYLQTGGKKGANIVSVNTSIGIDFAFPSDAPVWCALYDSLGSVGIVSSAATSNSNTNVDTDGDIPSTCPSNFLVVVSNTDADDNRINSGYGSSVDLAAPGQNVYTTTLVKNPGPNGPYKTESGTSFAAPLVAGEVALVYQSVCDTFLSLARSQPDSAARLMRSWVLSGTDALAVLSGKCVTGGRENMYKTWQAMNQWCLLHDATYDTHNPEIQGLVMYPNPVQQGSELLLSLPPSWANASVSITDLCGRACSFSVKEKREVALILDTHQLATGGYLIRISSGKSHLVRKLLVY
jgi:hypothetical protein